MIVDEQLLLRIGSLQGLAAGGGRQEAEARFADLWAEITASGDDYDACILAHYVAHAHDTAEARLDWHLRALSAADAVGDDRVRGFYPSLHANLADTYLRLGDHVNANRHAEAARSAAHVLGDDGYGNMVRSLIDRLTTALAEPADQRNSAL